MKTINILYLFCFIFILISCGSRGGDASLIDSLQTENKNNAKLLQDYREAVGLLNATVDSISVHDGLIFVSHGDAPLTKEDVRENLERYELVLKTQQEKIKSLEESLKQRKDTAAPSADASQTLALVKKLQQDITAKNEEIAKLKSELEKSHGDLQGLKNKVSEQKNTIDRQTATIDRQTATIDNQSAKIDELNLRTQRQDEALARQDAILNKGYLLIGSKDDLKRKGITQKGKIVADGALDRSKFAPVDKKSWREITFTAKKPKILTNMPASSYELTSDGNREFKLTVINPSDFWKITSYLIIQTD